MGDVKNILKKNSVSLCLIVGIVFVGWYLMKKDIERKKEIKKKKEMLEVLLKHDITFSGMSDDELAEYVRNNQ